MASLKITIDYDINVKCIGLGPSYSVTGRRLNTHDDGESPLDFTDKVDIT